MKVSYGGCSPAMAPGSISTLCRLPSPQPSSSCRETPQVTPDLRLGFRRRQFHRKSERLSLDMNGTHGLSLPVAPPEFMGQ